MILLRMSIRLNGLFSKTSVPDSTLFYIKILVSEQGNTICEKTVEFSQIVDYEERQKGLS